MQKLEEERLYYELLNEKLNSSYIVIKRCFDVSFSLIFILLTTPIILISSLIIFLQDFKNPIFVQKRIGVNYQEFNLYKLRSMVYDAEKDGVKLATENDSRITKFGKFIRLTRIDELPQLFNVLKGEMSLIGPRPERKFFYKKFRKTIPNFKERLQLRPGLTGWAQVNGSYDIDPKEKLKLDLYYIDNLSFKLEMKIFFKTIKVILTRSGAR